MSVYWYAIGNDITLSDLKTINQKLKEKKMEQLSFNHDLLIDRFWLQRTEFGKRGVMIVEDFDVETQSFSRMTTYGLTHNKAELVLEALVTIGGLTVASEFDSRSPYYQAQSNLNGENHNKLKFSRKKDRIKAGIGGN